MIFCQETTMSRKCCTKRLSVYPAHRIFILLQKRMFGFRLVFSPKSSFKVPASLGQAKSNDSWKAVKGCIYLRIPTWKSTWLEAHSRGSFLPNRFVRNFKKSGNEVVLRLVHILSRAYRKDWCRGSATSPHELTAIFTKHQLFQALKEMFIIAKKKLWVEKR